jgi:hypothetical protein
MRCLYQATFVYTEVLYTFRKMKRLLSGGVTSRQNASSYYPLQLDACLEYISPHKFLQTNVLVIVIQLYLRKRKFKVLCILMLSLI